jgi:hypothetical protein
MRRESAIDAGIRCAFFAACYGWIGRRCGAVGPAESGAKRLRDL